MNTFAMNSSSTNVSQLMRRKNDECVGACTTRLAVLRRYRERWGLLRATVNGRGR